MKDGKELLLKIIDSKIDELSAYDMNDLKVDNVNLINLLSDIENDISNFYMATDNIIEKVMTETAYKDIPKYTKEATKIRDLLIGKANYNLKISITDEYKKTIDIFKKQLKELINLKTPEGVDTEKAIKDLKRIKNETNSYNLMKDFELISEIVKEYDEISYESNMYTIMKFINEHNLSIIKTPKVNTPSFDIKLIIKPKLDSRIIEILDKFEIKPKELPNYLLSQFKKCNVDEVLNTYYTIRKNKAEDSGVLHLINKENVLAKLILVLYATEESINGVVKELKDKDGNIDITLLKILLNDCLPCFLVKNNEYFKPKYDSFKKIFRLLKGSGVNYKALITKNPLFMLGDFEAIDYVLKYFEMLRVPKKSLINKCYKTLSVNPGLLVENIMVLRDLNINIEDYLTKSNYALLKVSNLNNKINYVLSKNNITRDNINADLLYKLILSNIYNKDERIKWSD